MKVSCYEIKEDQLNPKDKAFVEFIKLRISRKETLSLKQFQRIREIEDRQRKINFV